MPSEERQQPRSTRTLAQKILIATCILVAVLVIALMNVGAKLSDKDVAQADLVKNPAATLKTLHDNPYSVLVAQKWLRLDYTFIVVYVIAALLAPASLRLSGLRALVGYAAVAAVIGGAACDIREDLTVGAAYRGGGLALSAHIQTLTSWKFILVFFGMGLLIFLAAVKDKPIGEQVARWLRALYFLRIPIAVISVMVVLPWLDANSSKFAEMSRGIFSVEGKFELFFAALAAFSLSWSAMIVSRVILAYGSERFSLTAITSAGEKNKVSRIASPPEEIEVTNHIAWTTLGLWSVPAWFFVGRVIAVADYQTSWWVKWVVALIAAFIALFLLVLADVFRLHERDGEDTSDHAFVLPMGCDLAKQAARRTPSLGRLWKLFRLLGPGYTEVGSPTNRVHSGHMMAALLVFILAAIYAVMGVAFSPDRNPEYVAVAAYVASLLGIILWIGAALSFFLDRFRVPVVFAFLAGVSALTAARQPT